MAERGLEMEDVEHVLMNPEKHIVSRSTGRPMILGHSPSGEYLAAVYEELDEDTVYPVTA